MSCSTAGRLGVVGGEVAWGSSEAVVERDRGGQGEELGGQAGAQGVQFSSAVGFEAEHLLGGLEDALHTLADGRQVRAAAGFVLASGAEDEGAESRGVALKVPAGVALVADDRDRAVVVKAAEHVQADFALADLRARQRQRPGSAVEREDPMQPEAPEEAA